MPPTEKNKEHVLPRWLIEMTGDPKRIGRFGFSMKSDADSPFREFAFDQFTFPACEACNTKHSTLEARTKATLEKINDRTLVTSRELSGLLDWFDKVRVGLWLGFQLLNKNILDIDPNFHIETRIGQFDRMLCIQRSTTSTKRLNFAGADTPAFAYMPSAFALTINDLVFTNVSYSFLVSRRLGFPYANTLRLDPDRDGLLCTVMPARRRIMRPVIQRPIRERGVFIYQPMFPQDLSSAPSTHYDDDYVRVNSLDFPQGVGAVFLEEPGSPPRPLTEKEQALIDPKPIYEEEEQLIRSVIEVCDWQDWLIQTRCTLDELRPDQRRYVRRKMTLALRVNDVLRRHHAGLLQERGYGNWPSG